MADLVTIPVQTVRGQDIRPDEDSLAVEEPLEIRIGFNRDGRRVSQTMSITMRTPGHDRELAAGFLMTEGIICSSDDIEQVNTCAHASNVVQVELRPEVAVDMARLERHFNTTSACGVCGKTSLAAVGGLRRTVLPRTTPVLEPELIHQLPQRLRAAQPVFDRTGGLHAAGLFDAQGTLRCLRKDVGRHNALDKLIGAQLRAKSLPLSQHVLLLSGRASFELVQKAMMAGIPIVGAVGAPSNLAVDLARYCGMTLLGFVRHGRFTIYAGRQRILDHGEREASAACLVGVPQGGLTPPARQLCR
jgi:FdhD protein